MLSTKTDNPPETCPADWQMVPLKAWVGLLPDQGAHDRGTRCRLEPVAVASGLAMLKQTSHETPLSASSLLLRHYDGKGSVRVLKHQKTAQLLEWVDGPSLAGLLESGEETQALDILADVIKKLHAPREAQLPANLPSLDDHFAPLLAQRHSLDPLIRHGARLAAHLLDTSTQQIPLHGDLHFGHILQHASRGWLAIAPKGMYGDPHFEAVAALCFENHTPLSVDRVAQRMKPEMLRNRLIKRADRLAAQCQLERDRLLTFAFCAACLQALIDERSGDTPLPARDLATTALDTLVS